MAGQFTQLSSIFWKELPLLWGDTGSLEIWSLCSSRLSLYMVEAPTHIFGVRCNWASLLRFSVFESVGYKQKAMLFYFEIRQGRVE